MVTTLPLLLHLPLALLLVRGRGGPWEKRRDGEGRIEKRVGGREGGREKEKRKEGMKGRVVGKDRIYNTATIPGHSFSYIVCEVEESERLAEVLHSIPVATSFSPFHLVPCIELDKSLKM